MLTVIQNIDLFCSILQYLNFQELMSLRCLCTVSQELTYDAVIQEFVLCRCDRRMAHTLFQANVRLKDAAILVDKYGGWNSAKKRLIQRRLRFKKKCDRFSGKLLGPQYYDYSLGKFVDTYIHTSIF